VLEGEFDWDAPGVIELHYTGTDPDQAHLRFLNIRMPKYQYAVVGRTLESEPTQRERRKKQLTNNWHWNLNQSIKRIRPLSHNQRTRFLPNVIVGYPGGGEGGNFQHLLAFYPRVHLKALLLQLYQRGLAGTRDGLAELFEAAPVRFELREPEGDGAGIVLSLKTQVVGRDRQPREIAAKIRRASQNTAGQEEANQLLDDIAEVVPGAGPSLDDLESMRAFLPRLRRRLVVLGKRRLPDELWKEVKRAVANYYITFEALGRLEAIEISDSDGELTTHEVSLQDERSLVLTRRDSKRTIELDLNLDARNAVEILGGKVLTVNLHGFFPLGLTHVDGSELQHYEHRGKRGLRERADWREAIQNTIDAHWRSARGNPRGHWLRNVQFTFQAPGSTHRLGHAATIFPHQQRVWVTGIHNLQNAVADEDLRLFPEANDGAQYGLDGMTLDLLIEGVQYDSRTSTLHLMVDDLWDQYEVEVVPTRSLKPIPPRKHAARSGQEEAEQATEAIVSTFPPEVVFSQSERAEQLEGALKGVPAPGQITAALTGITEGYVEFMGNLPEKPDAPFSILFIPSWNHEISTHPLMPLIPLPNERSGPLSLRFSYAALEHIITRNISELRSAEKRYARGDLDKVFAAQVHGVLTRGERSRAATEQQIEDVKRENPGLSEEVDLAVGAVRDLLFAELALSRRIDQAFERFENEADDDLLSAQVVQEEAEALLEILTPWPRHHLAIAQFLDEIREDHEPQAAQSLYQQWDALKEGVWQEGRLVLPRRADPEVLTIVYYMARWLALEELARQMQADDHVSQTDLELLFLRTYYLIYEEAIVAIWVQTARPPDWTKAISQPIGGDRVFLIRPGEGAGGGWKVRHEVWPSNSLISANSRVPHYQPERLGSVYRPGDVVALGYLSPLGPLDADQWERFFEDWLIVQRFPGHPEVWMAPMQLDGSVRFFRPTAAPQDWTQWAQMQEEALEHVQKFQGLFGAVAGEVMSRVRDRLAVAQQQKNQLVGERTALMTAVLQGRAAPPAGGVLRGSAGPTASGGARPKRRGKRRSRSREVIQSEAAATVQVPEQPTEIARSFPGLLFGALGRHFPPSDLKIFREQWERVLGDRIRQETASLSSKQVEAAVVRWLQLSSMVIGAQYANSFVPLDRWLEETGQMEEVQVASTPRPPAPEALTEPEAIIRAAIARYQELEGWSADETERFTEWFLAHGTVNRDERLLSAVEAVQEAGQLEFFDVPRGYRAWQRALEAQIAEQADRTLESLNSFVESDEVTAGRLQQLVDALDPIQAQLEALDGDADAVQREELLTTYQAAAHHFLDGLSTQGMSIPTDLPETEAARLLPIAKQIIPWAQDANKRLPQALLEADLIEYLKGDLTPQIERIADVAQIRAGSTAVKAGIPLARDDSLLLQAFDDSTYKPDETILIRYEGRTKGMSGNAQLHLSFPSYLVAFSGSLAGAKIAAQERGDLKRDNWLTYAKGVAEQSLPAYQAYLEGRPRTTEMDMQIGQPTTRPEYEFNDQVVFYSAQALLDNLVELDSSRGDLRWLFENAPIVLTTRQLDLGAAPLTLEVDDTVEDDDGGTTEIYLASIERAGQEEQVEQIVDIEKFTQWPRTTPHGKQVALALPPSDWGWIRFPTEGFQDFGNQGFPVQLRGLPPVWIRQHKSRLELVEVRPGALKRNHVERMQDGVTYLITAADSPGSASRYAGEVALFRLAKSRTAETAVGPLPGSHAAVRLSGDGLLLQGAGEARMTNAWILEADLRDFPGAFAEVPPAGIYEIPLTYVPPGSAVLIGFGISDEYLARVERQEQEGLWRVTNLTTGASHEFSVGDSVVLGRLPTSNLQLNHEEVSRQHAEVTVQERGFHFLEGPVLIVKDGTGTQQSSNGTFVRVVSAGQEEASGIDELYARYDEQYAKRTLQTWRRVLTDGGVLADEALGVLNDLLAIEVASRVWERKPVSRGRVADARWPMFVMNPRKAQNVGLITAYLAIQDIEQLQAIIGEVIVPVGDRIRERLLRQRFTPNVASTAADVIADVRGWSDASSAIGITPASYRGLYGSLLATVIHAGEPFSVERAHELVDAEDPFAGQEESLPPAEWVAGDRVRFRSAARFGTVRTNDTQGEHVVVLFDTGIPYTYAEAERLLVWVNRSGQVSGQEEPLPPLPPALARPGVGGVFANHTGSGLPIGVGLEEASSVPVAFVTQTAQEAIGLEALGISSTRIFRTETFGGLEETANAARQFLVITAGLQEADVVMVGVNQPIGPLTQVLESLFGIQLAQGALSLWQSFINKVDTLITAA